MARLGWPPAADWCKGRGSAGPAVPLVRLLQRKPMWKQALQGQAASSQRIAAPSAAIHGKSTRSCKPMTRMKQSATCAPTSRLTLPPRRCRLPLASRLRTLPLPLDKLLLHDTAPPAGRQRGDQGQGTEQPGRADGGATPSTAPTRHLPQPSWRPNRLTSLFCCLHAPGLPGLASLHRASATSGSWHSLHATARSLIATFALALMSSGLLWQAGPPRRAPPTRLRHRSRHSSKWLLLSGLPGCRWPRMACVRQRNSRGLHVAMRVSSGRVRCERCVGRPASAVQGFTQPPPPHSLRSQVASRRGRDC